MGNVETEKIDIGALINEVGAEVDALIKTEGERLEQEKLQALKKSEESSKEQSKEESSKSMEKKEESKKEESSMKKDESSGFESPAPEASSPSPEMAAPPSPEGSQDQAESLDSMIQSLDDSMLDELIQSAMMEKDKRSQSSQSAPPSPSPDMSQSAPAQDSPKLEMAYKKEVEDMKEKLSKSEETAKNLEVAFNGMTELFDKIINRPVQKAVTDIRDIEYADKGEKELKKTEKVFSETEVKEKLYKMGHDHKQLEKLTKNEREALSSFFVTKKQTPEVLKLIYK